MYLHVALCIVVVCCVIQLATLFQRACRAASEAALSSPTPATPLLPTPQSVACTRPTGVRAIHLQTSAVNGAATAAARAEHAPRSTTAQQGSRGGHWEHSRNGGGSGDGGGRSDWKPWSAASCLLLSWTPITLIGFSNEKNSEQGEESTTPVTKSVTAKELKKLVTEADQLHRAGEVGLRCTCTVCVCVRACMEDLQVPSYSTANSAPYRLLSRKFSPICNASFDNFERIFQRLSMGTD